MQQSFSIEGENRSVQWERLQPPFRLRLQEREVTVVHHRPGLMILEDGQCLRYAGGPGHDGGEWTLDFQGQRLAVEPLKANRSSSEKSRSGLVKSPMNGVVSKLEATLGAALEAGQVVLVLEAMKMENEVVAPVSGTLARLEVAQGQVVTAHQILFEIQA